MYKCGKCNIKFDLSDEHYDYIFTICKKNDICKTIIICPECGNSRIVGGEADWDEFEEKACIMMFGYDLSEEEDLETRIKMYTGERIN